MTEATKILERLEAIQSRLDALTRPWPEWMSIETAAHYCDCSTRKIRRAIQSGALRSSRPNDGYHSDAHVRIARTDLNEWMRGPAHGLPVLTGDGRIEGKAKLEALRAGEPAWRERE